MKFINFYRKPISVFVMVAFTILLCFWANQSPAAPAAEKNSAAVLENSNGNGSGFVEREQPEPAVKKGKKFPWLIVAAVVVVGGAALYFLVLKKKDYTLTVTVGEGVSGTPVAGTSTNKKGTTVAYSYSLQGGYSDLSVTLDGAAVAASGTVTMNANHTLAASAIKTYVLTVSRGEHVDGTPASGTYSYASGTTVNYSYAAASGYANLKVKIDNVAASNSGAILMNANHALGANLYGANLMIDAEGPTGEARIYLDGVNTGFSTPHSFYFPTAVTKAILLRYDCGWQQITQTISVDLGQTKTFFAIMQMGIKEDFTIPASNCWGPYSPSSWSSTITGDQNIYKYKGSAPKFSVNFYYKEGAFCFDVESYTVTVPMNRKSGGTWATGLLLSEFFTPTSVKGYLFVYYPSSPSGQYGIFRLTNYNLIAAGGTSTLLKIGTSSAIKTGLNKWNTLKIVVSGFNNYSFYINNSFMDSFYDTTYDPGYLCLIAYNGGASTEVHYDYVHAMAASSAGSVPGRPVKITPEMGKENLHWDFLTGERKD